MRYPNVAQVTILLPILRLTSPTESFPWNDLRKILHGGQGMAKVQNGEEVLPKILTPEYRAQNVTENRRIRDSKDPNVRTWLSVGNGTGGRSEIWNPPILRTFNKTEKNISDVSHKLTDPGFYPDLNFYGPCGSKIHQNTGHCCVSVTLIRFIDLDILKFCGHWSR